MKAHEKQVAAVYKLMEKKNIKQVEIENGEEAETGNREGW